jgi:ATP-dependent helicase/nuclease subunit A
VSGGGGTPIWTPEQKRGIETTGRSLLVSAAAGSGKTAVLAQRCAYLVCDADPRCDIDQLLVVTFTEAAAAEMKSRIEQVLRTRRDSRPNDEHPARQLAMVERAHVGTLHGFCSRLLRQNFHLVGLDPAFQMLDGEESRLMRVEVARDVLAARYEEDPGGEFGRFVEWYGGGDDEGLINHIVRTHELLCSLVDVPGWIARARERVEAAAAGELRSSELGRELAALVAAKLSALRRRCDDAAEGLARMPGMEKPASYVRNLGAIADEWQQLFEANGFDALATALGNVDLGRRPSIKSDVPGGEAAKALIEAVQKEMKEGSLVQLARFSAKQWRDGVAVIAPMVRVFLELVEAFGAAYRRAKDAARRLDFSDLERFALAILRDSSCKGHELWPSGVARGCHRQYQHVLVDEYQDINEVQDAILHLVSRECVEGDPACGPQNLFCVGDVKQSIYRFRLAEPARFLKRDARFRQKPEKSSGEVIDLQANFRSRAPLLGVINGVFQRLMSREAADIEYDQSHELRPGLKYPAEGGECFVGAPVELHVLPADVTTDQHEDGGVAEEELDRSEREAAFVARRIRRIMGIDPAPFSRDPKGNAKPMCVVDKGPDGQLAPRPIRFRDIVILLRSMKVRADQYANVLRSAEIPVFREGGQGYFESMEVRDIRSLLTLLDNQRQDIPMAAVLRSPLSGLAEQEDCLARIRLAYDAREVLFHQAVIRYAAERDDELAAALRDFLEKFARWRDLARQRPLAELIWEIYDQTGYLAFCEGLANGPQRVANLVYLHERARQFGTFSRQGLYRFLKFLDSLEAETDFGQPSVLSEAEDVVRIMSVHHSKGLEFPVVFLPELGKRINLQDCYGPILIDRDAGVGLSVVDERLRVRYPSLASVLLQESLLRQSLAEELRVLYVAMTRAREHLILSGTCDGRTWERGRSLWTARAGKMPAADVLGARTMLDWVGPAALMAEGGGAFAITCHSPEEVGQWTGADLKRPALSKEQQRLARLEPMDPAPPAHPRAGEIIERLTRKYPFAGLSRLESARSVTAWTKEGREAAVGYVTETSGEKTVAFDRTLAEPRFLLDAKQRLSAADVGSATHLVLQHLDWSRSCEGDDLAEQINAMIGRRLLAPGHARVVDLDAIEWFASSELGRWIRSQDREGVRREVPFNFAIEPSEVAPGLDAADAQDRVMVRGRIDLLVIEPDGLTLLDYKTDRVAPERLAERIEFYGPQVAMYKRAMEAIAGRRVKDVFLGFLHARHIARL